MFLGGTTWVFRWTPPYEKAICQIADLGWKGVELTVWSEEAMLYYTPEKNRELRKLIADRGMELTGVFFGMSGSADADPAKRNAFVESYKRATDIGNQLGSPKMIICTPPPFEFSYPKEMGRPNIQTFSLDIPKGLDFDRNYEDFIECVGKLAGVCEELDNRLAFEPHPHRYTKNADSVLRILERIDSKRLGMNIDPSHLFPMGELPDQVIYQLADRVFGVHVSDNDGLTNAHWRPGKGKIDWHAFFRALKAIGYDGNITVELEDVPSAAGLPSSPFEPVDPLAKPADAEPIGIAKEYQLTAQFLRQVCQEEGLVLE